MQVTIECWILKAELNHRSLAVSHYHKTHDKDKSVVHIKSTGPAHNRMSHIYTKICVVCNITFFKYIHFYIYLCMNTRHSTEKKLHLNRSEMRKKRLSNTCRASSKEQQYFFYYFFPSQTFFQSVSRVSPQSSLSSVHYHIVCSQLAMIVAYYYWIQKKINLIKFVNEWKCLNVLESD